MNLKTEVTRKQSKPNFPKNENVLPPDTQMYVCVSGVWNDRFSENLPCFVFLLPVLRFALLPYYRRLCIGKILRILSVQFWWHSIQRNFLWKTRDKGFFPLILCAFDFAGRYMKLFISEDLLSANAQTFTFLKHMICYKQLLLESFKVTIALRVIHGQFIFSFYFET